ncbi:RebB family R body protein [Burkholderia plantarii]
MCIRDSAAHNATNAQQQSYVTSQAATTMGVATLYACLLYTSRCV